MTDREKAIKVLEDHVKVAEEQIARREANGFPHHPDQMEFIGAMKEAIESMKTGEWEERIVEDDNPWVCRRFYCTACGNWITYGKTKFCPNCGAEMRREDEPGN